MNKSITFESLKEKFGFLKNVFSSDNQDYILSTYNNNEKVIIVRLTVKSILGNPKTYRNTFYTLEEANEFLETLKKAYIIHDNSTKKINFATNFSKTNVPLEIYIDGKIAEEDKLISSYNEAKRNLKKKFFEQWMEFSNLYQETRRTYRHYNNPNELITSQKSYTINGNNLISIIKKINQTQGNEKRDLENKLNLEIVEIFKAMEEDKHLMDMDLPEEINDEELIEITNLLEKLTNKLKTLLPELKSSSYPEKPRKLSEEQLKQYELNTSLKKYKEEFKETTFKEELNTPGNYKKDKFIKEIQNIQNEVLTPEEKEALIIYKAIFYRVINNIVEILRLSNITLEEALNIPEVESSIIELLSEHYDKYKIAAKEDKAKAQEKADILIINRNLNRTF